MNQSRRIFLRGSFAAGMVAVAAGAGLLVPRSVLAAWPQEAFGAKDAGDALRKLLGTDASQESAQIKIKAPDIAENGSVVPVTVNTDLAGLESISVMVMENARPLTVVYEMTDGVAGYTSTRVKMGKTSEVVVIAKADGKLYSAKKAVKVTLGGCGG